MEESEGEGDEVVRWVRSDEELLDMDERQRQQQRAIIQRLIDDDVPYSLTVGLAPFHHVTNPLPKIEFEGVTINQRFLVRVFTASGWRIELVVRIADDWSLHVIQYVHTQISGFEGAEPAGEPMQTWAAEGLRAVLAKAAGDGLAPTPPPQSRRGRIPVPDELLVEAVRLHDEGRSLRSIAMELGGSPHANTAKRWLQKAEERGLR